MIDLKRTFNFKKMLSIFMSIVMLVSMSCVSVFAADKSSDVQEMTYLGEIDGVPTWEAIIPLTSESNNGISLLSDADLKLKAQQYDRRIYFTVSYTHYDVVSMSGSCYMHGPLGNETKNYSDTITGVQASLDAGMMFDIYDNIKPMTQYFDVDGDIICSNSSNNYSFSKTVSLSVQP